MSTLPTLVLAACAALAPAALAAPAQAPRPGDDPSLETVTRYARALMAQDGETLASLEDETMQRVFTAAQVEQIATGLVAQNGPLTELGQAWHEDDLQGYHRYRVPAEFERATLDLRVVLDGAGKVSGLFILAHLEPPGTVVAPVAEEPVVLGEEDTRLPGTLSLPDGDGPFPGLVLVHGSGPNDRDETIGPNKPFRDLAWGLAQRGVAVLRYDKRSYARPADLMAVGDDLTVQQEVIDDAVAALAWLRARDDVDRVFLLGHSLGGTVAPRIAQVAPRPAGVIVLAGASLSIADKMLEQSEYIAGLDGKLTGDEQKGLDAIRDQLAGLEAALREDPLPSGNWLGAPAAYWADLAAHDPPAEAAALGLPLLVLQGGRDYQVTREDFGRWRAALADVPGACLVLHPALDHLFRSGEGPSSPADYQQPRPVDPAVLDEIAAWIREGTCPGS